MGEGRYKESEIGLPPLFTLRGFEGSLSEYVEQLYWQYRAMVDHAGIRILGKPLAASDAAARDGRDRLFWHLITSGTSEGGEEARRLDLTRCAHLPRVWDLLERCAGGDPRVRYWRQVDWFGRHVRVAAHDWSMVVVLLERPRSLVLRTAYPVEGRARRGTLRSQARASWMRAWAASVSSEELYARARESAAPDRPRLPVAVTHAPAAIERVRCWM